MAGYVKNEDLRKQIGLVLKLQSNIWDEIKCLIVEFKKLDENDIRRKKASLYIVANKPHLNHGMFISERATNVELREWENTFTENLTKLSNCEDYLLDLF